MGTEDREYLYLASKKQTGGAKTLIEELSNVGEF